MAIEIKNRFTGEVILTVDAENLQDANLQDANLRGSDLQDANLQDANLRGSDLQYADLQDANLRGANLQDANLRGANLQYADLRGANLRGANLQDANLRGADLQYADLRGAGLWGCAGNQNEIKSIFASEDYQITYTATHIQIGCQLHSIEEWKLFDDKEILEMDGKKALKFWREWKDTIFMIIEKSPAKPTKKPSE